MLGSYDTAMIPQVDLLRVCMSCWRRVPSFMSRQLHHHTFPGTSALVCKHSCGQRWASILKSTSRFMTSQPKDDTMDLTSNPFFDKYKRKIKHLQQDNPGEFESRLDDLKNLKTKKVITAEPSGVTTYSTTPLTRSATAGPRSWPPQSLDEIMKLDLVKDLPPDAIKLLWQEFHLNKDCIFSVVPKVEFEEIISKSKLSPTFLFPLPKGDGFEFYLCQFNGKDVYFTPLGMFQLLKESAPACLSVAHFPELKDTKGIVLMAGEYDDKILKRSEALNLVKQMALYYGKEAGDRYRILRQFCAQPDTFDHMQLVEVYNSNKDYLENNPY